MQSPRILTQAEALYERQLNTVESLIEFHPAFLEVLTDDELRLFRRYFLPDWDNIENFRDYFRDLIGEDPNITPKAEALLVKVASAARMDTKDLLTASSAD